MRLTMAARGSGKTGADSGKKHHDTQLAMLLAVGTTARKPGRSRWFGRRASAAGTSATDRGVLLLDHYGGLSYADQVPLVSLASLNFCHKQARTGRQGAS